MGKLSQFDYTKRQDKRAETVSEEDIAKKYNSLKDMPKDQLERQLFDEVAKQKREGTFDYEQLESLIEGLKSGLSEQDYQNVKRMLSLLK